MKMKWKKCFVWSVQSVERVYSLLSWRALARRLRCVWIRVLVIWHPMTHTIIASFVWAKSTHAISLRGKSACTVSLFSMKKLRSRLSLFSRKEGQPSASHDSGPTAAKAQRRMKSWGSQLDLADELERDRPFLRASVPRTRVSCWIVMMQSFWHHQIQLLVLCWVMPRKSRRDVWGRGSWDWTLSILLYCIWRVIGGYG